jgi:hypothetical protein
VVGTLLSTSLDASGGNLVIARDAGGWASTLWMYRKLPLLGGVAGLVYQPLRQGRRRH